MTEPVSFLVDGEPLEAEAGLPLGAVLHRRNPIVRRSLSGEPRGLFCGMGVCFECQVRIDGRLARACLEPITAGMRVETGPDQE